MLGVRALEGIPVERARLRMTLTRTVRDWLSMGIEINPRANDVGLIANARVLSETANRPAIVLGTSSDRIGTPTDRAYYATLSKDLEAWTGLPIAPYVGAAWGDFEDTWRVIGGTTIRWDPKFSTTHIWDGENLHHVADWVPRAGRRIGLVVVGQDERVYLGLRFGFGF